jgi:hypothetical protein
MGRCSDLCSDVWCIVATFTDAFDFAGLALVSKSMACVARDNGVWERMLARDFLEDVLAFASQELKWIPAGGMPAATAPTQFIRAYFRLLRLWPNSELGFHSDAAGSLSSMDMLLRTARIRRRPLRQFAYCIEALSCRSAFGSLCASVNGCDTHRLLRHAHLRQTHFHQSVLVDLVEAVYRRWDCQMGFLFAVKRLQRRTRIAGKFLGATAVLSALVAIFAGVNVTPFRAFDTLGSHEAAAVVRSCLLSGVVMVRDTALHGQEVWGWAPMPTSARMPAFVVGMADAQELGALLAGATSGTTLFAAARSRAASLCAILPATGVAIAASIAAVVHQRRRLARPSLASSVVVGESRIEGPLIPALLSAVVASAVDMATWYVLMSDPVFALAVRSAQLLLQLLLGLVAPASLVALWVGVRDLIRSGNRSPSARFMCAAASGSLVLGHVARVVCGTVHFGWLGVSLADIIISGASLLYVCRTCWPRSRGYDSTYTTRVESLSPFGPSQNLGLTGAEFVVNAGDFFHTPWSGRLARLLTALVALSVLGSTGSPMRATLAVTATGVLVRGAAYLTRLVSYGLRAPCGKELVDTARARAAEPITLDAASS